MDKFKARTILAALLHDIGKLGHRGNTSFEISKFVEQPSHDWHLLAPSGQQDNLSYQRAILTYQFFENYKDIFSEVLGSETSLGLASLASKHHNPDKEDEALIQLAAMWSLSIDTNQLLVDEKAGNSPEQLHSIFDNLMVDLNGQMVTGQKKHLFELRPLSLNFEDIFPVLLDEKEPKSLKTSELEKDYSQLWHQFQEEFQRIPVGSIRGFITTLLYLLKKYTWCVPYSPLNAPNVSLFEHLKTTAAFAGCFHDFSDVYPDALATKSKHTTLHQGHDPVLMCCLDISGIQQFIYDIASKKAFQSLKGRSFYLQLLLDQLLEKILNDAQIAQSEVNVIYSSGGKAYFLLPNTPVVKTRLIELYEEIQKFLWDKHRGKIYAALGHISFRYEFNQAKGEIYSAQAPNVKQLGDLWREVSELAAVQKRRRFQNLLLGYDDFFDEHSYMSIEAQSKETCHVTGEPLVGQGATIGDDEDAIVISPEVEAQINLGRALKDATVVIHQNKGSDNKWDVKIQGAATMDFDTLGQQVLVLDELQVGRAVESKSGKQARFTFLNDTDFLRLSNRSDTSGYGFSFYGGNHQPIKQDSSGWRGSRLKTLEELCYGDDIDKETHKMGVLRMDVDNLGQIFIKGFSENDKSFAAYATLSFQLGLFFSGYINTIQNGLKGKEHLSILYAGGDDLFAVGRWDVALDFAQQVRTAFEQFTGRHDLSISAGLAIVDRKYPIYKAAEIAGNAEDEAKRYKSILGSKNAICFFDETVSWDTEFDEVLHLKSEIINLINRKNGMSRGILHQLQRYKANRDFIRRMKCVDDFSYKWHSAYYLKRFSERYGKATDIRDFVLRIQARLLHDTVFGADRFMELIVLAARWAEYELKFIKPSKHEDNGEDENRMGDR
ncbi:MAG TPA: type III-A CRISPR-associated protein Cas10/Csm1 [Saprospiraceae bacterium]|nr:type III-A CRISPR-associated protein Cas10/Csm1 [Saprospiraceae bacterium]